jgi:hypothetical protein
VKAKFPNPSPRRVKLTDPVLARFCLIPKLTDAASMETTEDNDDVFSPTVMVIRRVALTPSKLRPIIQESECHPEAWADECPILGFDDIETIVKPRPYNIICALLNEAMFDSLQELAETKSNEKTEVEDEHRVTTEKETSRVP